MNKTVRMLALTGAAVAAGLSLGVAPASATPAAPASASVQADHDRNDHRARPGKQRFIGYYRTAGSCVKVGRIGRIHRKWDRFDCDKVRRGFHRDQYSLTVSWERRSSHR